MSAHQDFRELKSKNCNDITLCSPRLSPIERAQARIQHEGVLILDDDTQLLQLTGAICKRLWNLPDEKVVLVEVTDENASLLVSELSNILQKQIEDTGRGFAAVISDYNLSYAGNALQIWQDVTDTLSPECRKKYWESMGRVLISGFIPEEQKPDIRQRGLFDSILDKPFNKDLLENAVLASVTLHCSDELA